MRALYDCGRYLTSFNFFEWLVMAKADGATVVVFDIRGIRYDKWNIDRVMRRFDSILVQGCALAGLPYEIFGPKTIDSTKARNMPYRPGGEFLAEFCRSGRTFERLHSVKDRGTERYTITLRKTQRDKGRDSEEEVWRKFADEIGARVIEDYDVTPIHLHDRMALYAGAKMNFFGQNGPAVLCALSDYPYMMFDAAPCASSFNRMGINYGTQPPWILPNQRLIWEVSNAESVRRHFYHWRDTGQFAVDQLPEEI